MSYRNSILSTILNGTRRRYTGLEGEGLVGGGILVDRYVGCGAKPRRRSSGSKAAPRKRRASGGAGMVYMDFVRQWHMAHPEYTWQQAMKMAKSDYHAMKGSAMAAGAMRAPRRRARKPVGSKRAPRRRSRAGVLAGVLAAGARRRRAPRRR